MVVLVISAAVRTVICYCVTHALKQHHIQGFAQEYYVIAISSIQSIPQLLNDFLLRQYALGDRVWAGMTR